MTVAQPFQRCLVDRTPDFALKLRGEKAAAHSDLAVDSPDREIEPVFAQRHVPGADMIVDAVDQRSIKVKKESNGTAHTSGPTGLVSVSSGLLERWRRLRSRARAGEC